MRTTLVPWLAAVALVAHCAPRPDDAGREAARAHGEVARATARHTSGSSQGFAATEARVVPPPSSCVDFSGTYRGRCDGQGVPVDVAIVAAQQDCAALVETTELNGRQVRFEIDAVRHELGAGGWSLASWDEAAFPLHDHLRVELVDEQQGVVGRVRQQFVADEAGNLTLTLVNMRTVTAPGLGEQTIETCELAHATP